MKDVEFNDEKYNDDRMFVLYVCKCTVDIKDDLLATTIYHEEAPGNHKWCVVTYKNNEKYTGVRVDHFDSKDGAIDYVERVEPEVPLISLGGHSPYKPLPYNQFVEWKNFNRFEEYDYKKMYLPGGTNPKEIIYTKR